MTFFNQAQVAAAISLTFVLTACSGGGHSSTGGSPALSPPATPFPPSGSTWATRRVFFDSVQAANIAISAEFSATDASCAMVGCGLTSTGTQSSPFMLHNVNWAHSAGLTGARRLIAIVDSGFRLTHRELAGKSISQTGALPVDGHGTLVASIAAGNKDGLGMHGVAPAADLHLTSFRPSGSGFDIANVTAGTLAAASLNAVVQNNSWGISVSSLNLQNYLTANPGASVAQAMNATVGYGTANWQSYLNALDTFQNNGVVVWALSNDTSLTSGDIMAALPNFDSRLAEAWIAVANGYFEVNGSGDISRAVRLSAACGLAAEFCIAGDGIVTGAWSTSDTSYASGYGTSFVAPQVSGAVALLAEAFPDMTPAEWAQRLLASANNSWFTSQNVPLAGTVDFGNGVTHAYSTEWGHGVLDIRAALSPIGTVSVLSGATVSTAERYTLTDSTIAVPASFGDSISKALLPQELAVFDSLNRAYSVSTASAVASVAVSVLPRLPDLRDDVLAARGLTVAHSNNLAEDVGGLAGAGGKGSVLSMTGDGLLLASRMPVGTGADLVAYGFAAELDKHNDGNLVGGGLSMTLPTGSGTLSFGATIANEHGSVMGLESSGAFDFGSGSTIGAINVGIQQPVGEGISLYGRLDYGASVRQGPTSGLVSDLSGLTFAGMELGARIVDMLNAGDRLTISVSQPLRIETGTIELTRPVARMADGGVVNETTSADLKSSARQFDLGLSYEASLPNSADLTVGFKHGINLGHMEGKRGTGIMVGYNQQF